MWAALLLPSIPAVEPTTAGGLWNPHHNVGTRPEQSPCRVAIDELRLISSILNKHILLVSPIASLADSTRYVVRPRPIQGIVIVDSYSHIIYILRTSYAYVRRAAEIQLHCCTALKSHHDIYLYVHGRTYKNRTLDTILAAGGCRLTLIRQK